MIVLGEIKRRRDFPQTYGVIANGRRKIETRRSRASKAVRFPENSDHGFFVLVGRAWGRLG